MDKLLLIAGLAALMTLTLAQVHQESFCGVRTSDQNKTCISVRLPWQEAPIYFCTEKANIPFKDRCTDQLARYCPVESSNSTLLVATPWDCCTLSSTPDVCAERSCPSPPYNRTCREIAPDPSRPWECCPTFFCEADQTLSTCQMKRLEPSCLSPPQGKKNCVAFKDEHGCCNKFQCEGEGKPGMCPMQVQALHFRRMMEKEGPNGMSPAPRAISSTTTTTSKPGAVSTTIPPATSMSPNGAFPGFRAGIMSHSPITTDLGCVGDFNCPGTMKCCASGMSAYYDYPNSGGKLSSFTSKFGSSKDRAINGQCVEPVFMGPTE